MPTQRKYATNADRQAAYRARCETMLPSVGLPTPTSISVYRRWAALTMQARGILDGVAEEMVTYDKKRSEAWQNSERGELFQEHVETLEEILDVLRDLTGRVHR